MGKMKVEDEDEFLYKCCTSVCFVFCIVNWLHYGLFWNKLFLLRIQEYKRIQEQDTLK